MRLVQQINGKTLLDFGEPGINKNVYKVRITYTGGTSQNCNIQYAKDGSGTFLEFNADLNYTTNTTQQVVDLTPSAAINDIKSIQLKISGTAATTFELNDISIIYRRKGIRQWIDLQEIQDMKNRVR